MPAIILDDDTIRIDRARGTISCRGTYDCHHVEVSVAVDELLPTLPDEDVRNDPLNVRIRNAVQALANRMLDRGKARAVADRDGGLLRFVLTQIERESMDTMPATH